MNLKEAFRYQSFLERMLEQAMYSVQDFNHVFRVTKNHKCHDVNPDAEDFSEKVDFGEFYPNDSAIDFMEKLVEQRAALCTAINDAKEQLRKEEGIDIDAAISVNKFLQRASNSINTMLRNKGSTKLSRETGYKFNVDGNQTPYYYTVETVYEENFDRERAKGMAKAMIADADKNSTLVDEAMVKADVKFVPIFDVNDSFEDAMEAYLQTIERPE